MSGILVTGAAGFIGYHTVERLCAAGASVFGLDNFDPYYDPALKHTRLANLRASNFAFEDCDIRDRERTMQLFEAVTPRVVVHLAAQAGVRHSVENPHKYLDANVTGFLNVLDAARSCGAKHVVYASSSSVYGATQGEASTEVTDTSRPLSTYAATKKMNELMAHVYSHLHGITTTGLRLFTVYGPWGRPDMAPSLFANALWEGRAIQVFNGGEMRRDFTYVRDVAEAILRVVLRSPVEGDASVYNVGAGRPIALIQFIDLLARALNRSPILDMQPMQAGDVMETSSDCSAFEHDFGYAPSTDIETGVLRFAEWFLSTRGLSGSADGAFERPVADVVDLLFHGA